MAVRGDPVAGGEVAICPSRPGYLQPMTDAETRQSIPLAPDPLDAEGDRDDGEQTAARHGAQESTPQKGAMHRDKVSPVEPEPERIGSEEGIAGH
jgi:hypothetical protein